MSLSSHGVEFREATACEIPFVVKLVVEEFLRKGLRITTQQVEARLRDNHNVLVACKDGRIISTVSVITSNVLPMDKLFSGQLNKSRARGQRIVEIGKCAGRATSTIIMTFMAEAICFAFDVCGADVIGVRCHPDHSGFYPLYGFESLTPKPRYDHEVQQPASGFIATCSQIRRSPLGERYITDAVTEKYRQSARDSVTGYYDRPQVAAIASL